MGNGADSHCQEVSAAEAVLSPRQPLQLPPEYIPLPEPLQLTAMATEYESLPAPACITV